MASQQIDKEEWDRLKQENSKIVDQELDVFSDLVWEGVLQAAQYIEHFSKNHIFLFQFYDKDSDTIMIKSLNESVDFMTKEGICLENLKSL